MKRIRYTAALLVILLLTVTLPLGGTVNAQKGKAVIKKFQAEQQFHGVPGTTVIKNLRTNQVHIYNMDRSRKRFTPESSFKVPNALIGLDEHAVADEYEVKRWDGVIRSFDEWNRDHTLASAMRHSAIWYYQEMARDIGTTAMQQNLDRIHYGNQDISGGIDQFWLNSSLKISAREQAQFIEELVEETLPFQEQTMKTVKRIMIDNEQDAYTIHGKTGSRLSDMGLGWYIGYVETRQGDWVFATNVDSSGATAKSITLECLKRLKVL
ncbi:class D beta-lactamase [Paenibacillus cellulositrophicus]|uniref:class D beta-lactamase n=1 Tax=Paenibacillus cellulositrophicus TaxID=562959 RepID=UPI001267790F|nr:class D beta-lactamase [Paenibacillus cellulositrophicus]